MLKAAIPVLKIYFWFGVTNQEKTQYKAVENQLSNPKERFMKKIMLCCFALLPFAGLAQKITVVSNTKVQLDLQGRVVPPANKPNCRIWVEPGDGNVLNQNFPDYTPKNSAISHKPLMYRTFLYDTSRTRLSTVPSIGSLMMTNPLASMWPAGNGNQVMLRSNVIDVVSGDTMAFGVNYSLVDTSSQYSVVLLYNDGNSGTFNALTENTNFMVGSTSYKSVRVHKGEAITFNNPLGFAPSDGISYDNSIWFELPRNDGSHGLFVSLVPNENLTIGNNNVVTALLVQHVPPREKGGPTTYLEVAKSTLNSLSVAASHDPNDISVTPQCINKPVAANLFNYRVRFENLGEGPAEKVLIRLHLPAAMDWSTYSISEVSFGGEVFTAGSARVKMTHTEFPSGDSAEILIEGLNGKILAGFKQNDPNDPGRHGHVKFTIKSTATTAEELVSKAEIFFKSVTPLGALVTINGLNYQEGITTVPAVAKYMDDCAGNTKKINSGSCNCKSPSGIMCWITCYWWLILIILLILLILIWRLSRRRTP
jgi:hypothetical protein